MSFQQNKYQVIKKAIPYELANFIFNYFLLKREAVNYLYSNNIVAENGMLGTWKDQQVPNVYSHYADFVMETLLMKVMPIMKQQTNLNLIPTYSYARIYEKGSILKRHKDRPSCEISTTLNLGGDPWPIFIDPTGSNNVVDISQDGLSLCLFKIEPFSYTRAYEYVGIKLRFVCCFMIGITLINNVSIAKSA